jgi:hypothetical protein
MRDKSAYTRYAIDLCAEIIDWGRIVRVVCTRRKVDVTVLARCMHELCINWDCISEASFGRNRILFDRGSVQGLCLVFKDIQMHPSPC